MFRPLHVAFQDVRVCYRRGSWTKVYCRCYGVGSQGRPLFIGVGVDTKEAKAVLALRRGTSSLSHSIPLGKCFDTEG